MMKHRLLFVLLYFGFLSGVEAHRLNEYLQATTISLNRDTVALHLHLTAGTSVAPAILKGIDRNGDGTISDAEQQAYCRLIMQGLDLGLDGRKAALQLNGWSFPAAGLIAKGMGDIQLWISVRIFSGSTVHRLTLAQRGSQNSAVYMVNCLLPSDTGMQVISQLRNTDQSVYRLEFSSADGIQRAANRQQLETADQRATVKTYFFQGVRHILTGYDHLLFICALVLGAAGLGDLIRIITTFTIAHSITLLLAVSGYVHLPEVVVESLIAASIVFVAVQNISQPESARGLRRLVVVFFFGLIHGLGFAGGLLELMHAMPVTRVLLAILGFSLGVEAGNQLVLLPLFGMLQVAKHRRAGVKYLAYPRIQQLASGIVAIAGMVYLFIAWAAFA